MLLRFRFDGLSFCCSSTFSTGNLGSVSIDDRRTILGSRIGLGGLPIGDNLTSRLAGKLAVPGLLSSVFSSHIFWRLLIGSATQLTNVTSRFISALTCNTLNRLAFSGFTFLDLRLFNTLRCCCFFGSNVLGRHTLHICQLAVLQLKQTLERLDLGLHVLQPGVQLFVLTASCLKLFHGHR